MNGPRITFYGFAAYVGALRGQTTVDWWADDPNNLGWSPQSLVPVDLSKNPTAARANRIPITDIQCDDHRIDGGLTSIGPRFPQGAAIGAIWLTDTYYQSLATKPPWPWSPDAYEYEMTSLLYLPNDRFYGVHARIIGTSGALSNVEIWRPGRGRVPGEPPMGTYWLDLSKVAHPVAPGATQIGPALAEGALFLDAATAKLLSLAVPKIPPGSGFDLL
jgi:hypothetical protein